MQVFVRFFFPKGAKGHFKGKDYDLCFLVSFITGLSPFFEFPLLHFSD